MRDIIHDILYKYWGYESFREQQEEIILSVLAGKETRGLLPTGGGKSLTFQVPGLAMDGITLVITPLIALMKDQVDNLRERGIKARCIHSGMRRGEIRNIIDHCLYGKCKFLYRLFSTASGKWTSPSLPSTRRTVFPNGATISAPPTSTYPPSALFSPMLRYWL